MDKVFVFDPTSKDKLSSVRGIGRYLQILKEGFGDEWTFINNINRVDFYSVFINPFFNFLQTPLVRKRIAKKQIAVIHDLIPLKYPSHFPAGLRGNMNILLNKYALKNYDLVITDSEASKKDIINLLNISENKIKVIYPYLPKIFYPKGKDNKQEKINNKFLDTKFCLYVGDATWNKNLVNLVKAIKIINVTCVFVGKVFDPNSYKNIDSLNNKWQKELKQFLIETKDDKRFVLKGYLSDEELINLYKKATLNILPSRDEGFGFSYLEASQFYCPSVLSDISVLKEISADNALFINPENPNDIADKIGEIYFNKDIKDSLGKKSKERSKHFTSHRFRKEFLHCL